MSYFLSSGYMTLEPERKVNVQASNPADSNLVKFHGENPSANGGRPKKQESGKGEQTHIEYGVWGDKSVKEITKAPEPANDTCVAVGEAHNKKEVAHDSGSDKEKDLSGKSSGQDFASLQIPGKYFSEEDFLSNALFVVYVGSDSFYCLGPIFLLVTLPSQVCFQISRYCLIFQIKWLLVVKMVHQVVNSRVLIPTNLQFFKLC
jgi:hypothetical protein